MSTELLGVPKEKLVKGAVVTTVFLAGASSVFVARELIVRRNSSNVVVEDIAQSAADGNHVTTLEEVKQRTL